MYYSSAKDNIVVKSSLMPGCPEYHLCRAIQAYLDKGGVIPVRIEPEIHHILESATQLEAVHRCIITNPTTCFLSIKNELGGTTTLSKLLKPLQP